MAAARVAAAACVAVMALLAMAASPAHAEHSFPAHRLAHFDVDTSPKGSRSAPVDLLATAVDAEATTASGPKLNRRVVVLKMEDVSAELVHVLVVDRKAGGILILLPAATAEIAEAEQERFHQVELAMLSMEIPIPVYFSFLDEQVESMYADLVSSLHASELQATDNYQLTVTASKPTAVTSVPIENLQGWLAGAAAAGSEDELDTIAVVAHYDAFSAAPSLATGVDSNGSGSASLLELARLFSVLYDNRRTQGKYNLLFALTGAGHLGFLGAESWVESLDDKTADSIAFVLCLDSIGSGSEVVLHTAKKRTSPSAAPFFDAFEAVAKRRGVAFRIQHKKVNLADATVAWEHEHFAKQRMPAATVSALQAPRTGFDRSRVLDTVERLDRAAVHRNVQFVAEVLGAIVYGDKQADVFSGSVAVDLKHVDAWVDMFGRDSRTVVSPRGAAIADGMFAELRRYATDATRQSTQLDAKKFAFYLPGATSMAAYRVKPISFDVYFLLIVSAGCFLLHIALQGREAFKGVFAKSKTA